MHLRIDMAVAATQIRLMIILTIDALIVLVFFTAGANHDSLFDIRLPYFRTALFV